MSGPRRPAKEAFDRTAALVLLLLVLPFLIGVGLAVRVSGPGPVLVRQRRLGRDGQVFGMLAFRTRGAAVDARTARPRMTAVGRFLCRHGLHDLPRLVNVLRGEMSLVGPRAGQPGAAGLAGTDPLLVKPGLTGLRPAVGSSDLCWDDAARLDARYVENWSLTLDLAIIGRALRSARLEKRAR